MKLKTFETLQCNITRIDQAVFCMLITKNVGIQADTGALCPYLSIKVTWSLQYEQETKLVKFCA